MTEISKPALISIGKGMIGEDLSTLSIDQLRILITVTQYLTDCLLNELEERGALEMCEGVPVIPYVSDYAVETLLTREGLPN